MINDKVTVVRVIFVIQILIYEDLCEELPSDGVNVDARLTSASLHSNLNAHYDEDGRHNSEFDHEAILGSKKLMDEFAKLSTAEAKSRLFQLVQKIDRDGNGFVSQDELTEWVLQSFRNLDREDAIVEMKHRDTDKDGNITWSEYLESVYSGRTPEEVEGFAEDANPQIRVLGEMIDTDMEKFQAADQDKNGVLDTGEYTAFLNPHDFPYMYAVEIRRVLNSYDKNKNGEIDLLEYMQDEDFPQERNPETDIVDEENFRSYDENGDGVLKGREIRAWALPDHRLVAWDEAEHLMAECDRSRDGQLSPHEVLARYELWVGARAPLRDEL